MIYFMLLKETGYIKIGYSDDLQVRIWTLRQQYKNIELLGVMEGQGEKEGEVHNTLSNHRVKPRPWEIFYAHQEVLDFISQNTSLDQVGHLLNPKHGRPKRGK
jgi:hypothetical protein